ncbi:GxxExxY protein [Patescibacteria group bacterium]
MSLIHEELTYEIRGILFKIQNTFGRGLKEKQYSDLVEACLKKREIPYLREYAITINFEGLDIRGNVVDFLIDDRIILEIKAKNRVMKEDYWQLKRYLIAAKLKLGILVNLRSKRIEPQRIINKSGLLRLDPHPHPH